MSNGDVAERDSGPLGAITSAAMHLFGTQGYTGTSMRDIASTVGVLPGSLYAHIRSKEALLVDIVTDGIGRFQRAVQPIALSKQSATERMRRMILAHVEVVSDNPERAQVAFHQWRFLGPDSLAPAMTLLHGYEDLFVSVVRDGIADGILRPDLNIRITVLSMLGALNSIPEWFSSQGSLSMADIGNVVADTLLMGIQI